MPEGVPWTPHLRSRDRFERRWTLRFATNNPFYLISAACFIHSLSYAVGGAAGGLQAGPRTALICGYLALTVATSLVLVCRWRLWDDARSLLLIVLLLFVELGVGIDVVLVRSLTRGIVAALGVLLTVCVVSELLFRGLRLPFPAIYRVPYYILWGLIACYPVICAVVQDAGTERAVRWTIAAFLPICSLVLLTLLPAARQGMRGLRTDATPWPWPYYPWSAFVFVLFALIVRQHGLCVSFDSVDSVHRDEAYGLVSIFGLWMLAPLLFAVALLIQARATASKWKTGDLWAGFLPFFAIVLAFPGSGGTSIYREFVADLIETLGSPAWLAAVGCVIFQAFAWKRSNYYGPVLQALSLLSASLIDRDSLTWDIAAEPSPLWMSALTLFSAVIGVRRKSPLWLTQSGLAGLVTMLSLDWWNWYDPASVRVVAHLAILFTLFLRLSLAGRADRQLEAAACLGIATLSIDAVTADFTLLQTLTCLMYLATIACGSGLFTRDVPLLIVAAIDAAYVLSRGSYSGYQHLDRELEWRGLHWLTAALLAFLIGVGVSLYRSGIDRRPESSSKGLRSSR